MSDYETTLKMILLGEDRSAGKTLNQVGDGAEKNEGKLKKFGSVMSKAFVGGLLVGGAAMVKFGDQASDLAETQSKVTQIFGEDSVEALEKYSDAAAKNIGQSKQTALDALATFGVFGKGAGLAGDDLVKFSTQMTNLSSDMASFSNTSPEEAIEAIGAALRGESEPIRKYGVLLDDATLRNRALKLGLIETTKNALTPQQKALAAQAEILAQTKDQQGDFARTSDGLANSQRILKAELANMTTELGEKALPVMKDFVGILLDSARWVDKNHEVVVPLVAVLGGFVTAVWAINTAARAYAATQAALNIVLMANPIALVVVAVAALVAGLILAYQKSETFRAIVDGAFRGIATAAKFMWENGIKPVFKFWINTWFTVVGAMLTGAAKAFGWVPGVGGKLKNAAKKFNEFRDEAVGALDDVGKTKVKPKVDTSSIDHAIGRVRTLADLLTPGVRAPHVDSPRNLQEYQESVTGVSRHAVGTSFFGGGLSWVGERGPELAEFPRGTRMWTAADSARMAAGGGGEGGDDLGTITVEITQDGVVIERKLAKLKRTRGGAKLAFESS